MRSVSEGGRLSGLLGFFRSNKPFVIVALVVSLISVGCFLQTERTDYVKNDQGWQYPIYYRRWQMTLSDMTQKVKIVLSLPEKLDIWQKGSVVTRDFNENEYDRVRLEFWASGQSTGAYSLSVKLNGREVKRYPQGLRGNAQWHSIPLEGLMREAIRDVGEAEVIFSLSGAPSPETDYVTFYGDAAVASRNSSLFDGVDWTRDDLSEQPGDQQGEFYVRLAYAKSLFIEPSLTSERVVILLLYLAAICLLVLFRGSINSFRASMALSALKSTFKAYREIIVLLALVFVLALLLRSYFVARYPQPELIKDAALYDTQARNVVSGYGLAAKPPQLYPMFFGYTLLLAGVYSVLGHDLQAMHLFQAVLGSLTCVLVFLIAYRSFDKDKHLSLVAGLLACCFPPFIDYTGRLLTETLATFALALFVYLFIEATRATRKQLFILSGLAFGLAVISRDLFFYFLVFILAILAVTFWRNKGKVIRFTVLFLLGVILICSPLLARNALVFSPGRAFGTMVRLSFSQILALATDQNTVPAESKVAEDNPEKGQETGPVGTEDALPTEASSIKNDLIPGGIRYLWGYIERWAFKIDEFWYSAANWWDAAIFGIPLKYLLVFRRLIVFMAMLGVIASLPRWKEDLLLYSLVVYPSVVHAIFLPFPRYTIPWMPYVCIFAARGMATFILVFRSGGKYVALSLIAWATAFAMTMNVDKQSLLKLFGPLIAHAQLSVIRPYRLVIELCLIALIFFLLINHRKKIPNAVTSTTAILLAFGYVSLRGQTLPLSPYKEDVSSVLTDVDHYVGHLVDLPRWTQGYDRYFLKIKLDGAWIEPPRKKYGVRVFANGEMIKEYPINHEVIHGWERIAIDKRFIEGQKKLYVSLQVFGAPDVFENYLAVFIRQDKYYGLSVFNDSTRYLSIDRDEKQNGTFLIGLEMAGKGPYRDVDLWLGSRLSQADKLSLLGDESGVWYNLGEKIRLIGYKVSGTARPGEALRPRLYWQAQAPIGEDYTVFVQLLDKRGDLRAQQDCQPQRGDYPTFLWRRGEVIWDIHGIALPSDLPAGTYRLVAGMYLPESMERLPVFDGTGRRLPDNLIPLGEIQVVGF